jgi:hypothetical protein
VSGDLGSTVRIPFYNYAFFFGFDTQYESRNNTDTTGALSEYAWVRGSIITDANIGFGTSDGRYNVSVVVKNLTNNDVPLLKTYDTYEPAFARWWGFQVNGKL